MKLEYPTGATPLDPDEMNGLIPLHITTQNELNEWEAANILRAENWLFSTFFHGDFLTIDFIKRLHKKMFGDTWTWAGIFRNTSRNIGVEPFKIAMESKTLLDDVAYQISHNTYPIDEIAYRFHHRLVWIHAFPNGNGRHARTMTDFLLIKTGQPKFSWGKNTLLKQGPNRNIYLQALRDADNHDYIGLSKFVRS